MQPGFFNHLLLICQFELNRRFATRKGLLSLVTFAVLWYFILLYPLRFATGLAVQEQGLNQHLSIFDFIGFGSSQHWSIPEFDVFWQLALIIFPMLSITLAADQTCSDRERGTLRFIVLRSSRDRVFFGRFTGVMLFQALLISAAAFSTMALALSRDASLVTAALSDLFALMVNLVLIILPFTAMMAALSAQVKSARQVTLWAILIWTFMASIVSGLAYYVPGLDFNIHDVLAFINLIQYKVNVDETDIEFIENVNALIAEEFVKKIRNKINWHLNSSIYQYDQALQQSDGNNKGDFIEKYTVVKSFKLSKKVGNSTKQKTETELNKEIADFTGSIIKIQGDLTIKNIGNHIYAPLLKEDKTILSDDIKLNPDKLNDGEKKFVKDFTDYVTNNTAKFNGYDVYLMRNVESLKSIGLYLNDDSEVFYPDFIMWLITNDKVYINFIDPKGQMGTKDFATDKDKEKVTIADKTNNPTLVNIEVRLKAIHKKEFSLNSFILLRDSSELGKSAKQDDKWKKQNMIDKHILRLDWHNTDEKGSVADQTKLVDSKTYLDWIIEKTV